MKTIINIGTSLGSITNVMFDKLFDDITYDDILIVANDRLGYESFDIYNWNKID